MADKIKLLPEFVANQIAAGEVVNRPASVVKELMENAVDAGATSVTVVFRDGGREMIRILDDGCGMSKVDARMSFDRHATSKIGSAEDLYSLSTFGFRGEALASIAAVAEVGLRTRREQDELGIEVEIAGGKFVSQEPVSCPVGSQFTVRNLFYNVPARRRFLDKSSTESRHIAAEYQRVALCNPNVAFALYEGDTLLSRLPASSLKGRILAVAGQKIAKDLLEVDADTSIVKIGGFVGRPSSARTNNREQFLFVNDRYFRSGYFHKAVVAAYEKLVAHGTQPSYFLYFTIEPSQIDVNVHPQKTEIKFEGGGEIWQILNAAVRETLAKSGAVPAMDFDVDTSVEIPVYRQNVGDAEYREPAFRGNPEFNPFDGFDGGRGFEVLGALGAGSGGGLYSDDVFEFIERGEGAKQQNLGLGGHDGVGETLKIGRYGLKVGKEGLWIVDLRRAREATLYARYLTMLGSGSSACQQLLFPQEIALSSDDAALLRERMDDFTALGFDISISGEHDAMVGGVPADQFWPEEGSRR